MAKAQDSLSPLALGALDALPVGLRVVASPLGWREAQAECTRRGGHLYTPLDLPSAQDLARALQQHPHELWTGAYHAPPDHLLSRVPHGASAYDTHSAPADPQPDHRLQTCVSLKPEAPH